MATSYAADVRPLFRAKDMNCMTNRGVPLDDGAWMCDAAAGNGYGDHGNARLVLERLEDGSMPPDGGWAEDKLSLYRRWIADGFQA